MPAARMHQLTEDQIRATWSAIISLKACGVRWNRWEEVKAIVRHMLDNEEQYLDLEKYP